MTKSSTSTSSDASRSIAPRYRSLVSWAMFVARAGVVAVVVWLGWSCVTTFLRLLRDGSAQTITVEHLVADNITPFDWKETIAESNGWVFGDSNWSIHLNDSNSQGLDTRLTAPIADPKWLPKSTETERLILAWLVNQNVSSIERDGGWDFVQHDADVQFCIRTVYFADEQRIGWARVALRRTTTEWILLELQPDEAVLMLAKDGGSGPSLPGTTRVAARVDARGRVICEFVHAAGTLTELIEQWRRQEVTITEETGTFTGMQELLCQTRGQTVRIIAINESPTFGTTLLVVATELSFTPVSKLADSQPTSTP